MPSLLGSHFIVHTGLNPVGKGHPSHLDLATDTPHGVTHPYEDSPYPAQCQLFTPGSPSTKNALLTLLGQATLC